MLARFNGAVVIVVVGMAFSLCGCDDTTKWFAKPLNPFNGPGYTYSSLGDARVDRSITASDLIDANGTCPNYSAPAAPPSAPAGTGEGASPQDNALFGGGVALGMSECDIVARLGQATAVNFGTGVYGSRSLVLTYNEGPRPGIYRFENGRLSEMDRGARRGQPTRRQRRKSRRSRAALRATTDRDRSRSAAGTTLE